MQAALPALLESAFDWQDGGTGTERAVLRCLPQAPLQMCSKGWDTSSWVTGTTAGSRCSSSTYSSSFDCPAVCTWTSATLASNPQCAGLPPPILPPDAHNANATCLLHPPCSSATSDPAAPDGPCYCCALQLDSSAAGSASASAGTVPAAQLWVLFPGPAAVSGVGALPHALPGGPAGHSGCVGGVWGSCKIPASTTKLTGSG